MGVAGEGWTPVEAPRRERLNWDSPTRQASTWRERVFAAAVATTGSNWFMHGWSMPATGVSAQTANSRAQTVDIESPCAGSCTTGPCYIVLERTMSEFVRDGVPASRCNASEFFESLHLAEDSVIILAAVPCRMIHCRLKLEQHVGSA